MHSLFSQLRICRGGLLAPPLLPPRPLPLHCLHMSLSYQRHWLACHSSPQYLPNWALLTNSFCIFVCKQSSVARSNALQTVRVSPLQDIGDDSTRRKTLLKSIEAIRSQVFHFVSTSASLPWDKKPSLLSSRNKWRQRTVQPITCSRSFSLKVLAPIFHQFHAWAYEPTTWFAATYRTPADQRHLPFNPTGRTEGLCDLPLQYFAIHVKNTLFKCSSVEMSPRSIRISVWTWRLHCCRLAAGLLWNTVRSRHFANDVC